MARFSITYHGYILINNIQLLRAFAALSVVIYHTSFNYRHGVHTEFQGVAIFFVISGFIMTYISRENPARFFLNRCIRIIPLYFILTLTLFFWKQKTLFPFEIFHHLLNGDGVVDSTLPALLKSSIFIPYINGSGNWEPIVGVGWTLNLEMYFYILFSIALFIDKRFAPVIVGVAIIVINLFGGLCADGICSFYAQNYTLFFALGIIAYYLWRASISIIENYPNRIRDGVFLGGLGVTFFFFWHLTPEFVHLFSSYSVYINYLLPFLMVIIALFLHTAKIQCNWQPILVVGESSYALYLIHIFVIGQMRAMGHAVDEQSGWLTLLLVITLSSLLALVLHYGCERPITRYLRHKLMRGERNQKSQI